MALGVGLWLVMRVLHRANGQPETASGKPLT
jgi:hypothetical protein